MRVQLYHRGWDQHGGLATNMPKQCKDIDQPQAALIIDLKQHRLLEDTLVVWAVSLAALSMDRVD